MILTTRFFVGYKTKALPQEKLKALMPEFQAARNLKDPEKIKADLELRRAAYMENAANTPYTGTFDTVMISRCRVRPPGEAAEHDDRDVAKFSFRAAEEGGVPVCLRVKKWLLTACPAAWTELKDRYRNPEAVFFGFNPRLFLKMLGIECSLPEHRDPLPLRMWYDTDGYRDLEEALLPTECKGLTLQSAVARRRPVDPQSAEEWDRRIAVWKGPGSDAEADLWFTTVLAAQLGMVSGA